MSLTFWIQSYKILNDSNLSELFSRYATSHVGFEPFLCFPNEDTKRKLTISFPCVVIMTRNNKDHTKSNQIRLYKFGKGQRREIITFICTF